MDLDWRGLLKLNQDEVMGLDIGSSAVKMVQLRKDDAGWLVTAAGIVDIAQGEDKNGSDETNTVKAIRDCLRSTAIKSRFAVCSVCGPEVAVRHFQFPSLPDAEIAGAVILEAEQVCPFNISDASVDYQLISDGQNNVSGILVAATNKLIKRKKRLAEGAYLTSVLMDIDGLALLNCFKGFAFCRKSQNGLGGECEENRSSETIAILNVGSSFTNLAIRGNDALPFIRDMAYSGNDIVKQIAIENNVCPEIVGKILFGCEIPGQAPLELGDSLTRACQKLIVDVAETLRYYTSQKVSPVVEKIFVCGGFALVKGFVELLDNMLAARAVLWNPFDKIRCDSGRMCEDILGKNGPAMAVAAGLAMRSI